MIGAGSLRFDSDRVVAVANDVARANRDGSQYFGALIAGYELRRNGMLWSPYGRVDYSVNKLDQATESGAGLNALTYFAQRQKSLQGALGLRVESAHEVAFGWVVPRMRGEYRYDGQGAQQVSIAYADQVVTQFSSAALAARLLADDVNVTANAIAIAASHNNTLAQSQRGNIPMMKATAEAMISRGGVEAALLAARGLTGPEEIFEGAAGWSKIVAGTLDAEALSAPCHGCYRVMEACFKPFAAVAGAMAPVQAAMDLAREHAIDVAAIEQIVITLPANAANKAAGDAKKLMPRDKETADHSFHYCVAVALLDQACGEAQFSVARLGSAAVKGLIERTRIEASEALTALWPGSSGGGVQVRLGNGAVLEKMYRYPPGHPQNPLSDAAIERRLFELSHDVLPRVAAQAVIDAVWRLEADEDLARLASALAVDA